MIDAIKKRRAIREYLAEPVSDDSLEEILLSAQYAPSANALYPWELLIVKSDETKDLLSKVSPWAAAAKLAAAVIVVIGHETESPYWVEDGAAATTQMWLAAVERGLGACWIQIRNNNSAEKEVKDILDINDERRVLCLLAIGAPAKNEPEHDEVLDRSKVKNER
ncbi:MAG: nitroreductase family protein [Candidatus Buchananbacteria bacterium]|nr:nitroreductase family protein [Candidatus Buchananbacteria bacterium]